MTAISANGQVPGPTGHERVIAIDGPAAAGKSTVARILADHLGALLFDTGALYRAVALLALREGIDPGNTAGLCDIAANAKIRVLAPSKNDGRLYDVWLDGEDVTWAVREPDIGHIVSQVSEHPEVRAALLPLQRRIASEGPVVMVGRDIGTVVVPDAGLKIYLDASPHERANRRYQESLARGATLTYDEVLEETLGRDIVDTSRQIAPLFAARDAVQINSDDLSVDEVVAKIERLARQRKTSAGEALWLS